MKKAIIALVLLAALCLCGCGGKAAAEPAASPVPVETASPAPTAEPTPEPTEEPTPEPTAEPTPEPTPEATMEPISDPTAEPVVEPEEPAEVAVLCVFPGPGSYTYKISSKEEWKVQLRDDGLFTLIDPSGHVHTGEGWEENPDGTVTCGPTDIYMESFAFDGGCSRWVFSKGNQCEPLKP